MPQSIKSVLMHPAGPFTSKSWFLHSDPLSVVFFWAPSFKWMITISNIGDLEKPAHLISAPQQFAIFSTGTIWTRYAFAVTPVNYNLAVVNVFMSLSAGF